MNFGILRKNEIENFKLILNYKETVFIKENLNYQESTPTIKQKFNGL